MSPMVLVRSAAASWWPAEPAMWRRSCAAFVGLLKLWRERQRQRADLMTLVAEGFDFKDIGITRALASREASRFPWQAWDGEWRDVFRYFPSGSPRPLPRVARR
jgi:uncharacterized protein YjiS (DUF1127 family)